MFAKPVDQLLYATQDILGLFSVLCLGYGVKVAPFIFLLFCVWRPLSWE